MSAPGARPVTPDGLIIVDKPADWTSHDVVGRMRRLASTRRVGHAGTLDPMATGVLVLGINKATKLLTFLVGCEKEYTATIRLGQTTITDDAEGDVTSSESCESVSDEAIAAAVESLTGDIQQVPSSVSAIKVNGERSYARVRGGEEVKLQARPVTVSKFSIKEIRRADVEGLAVIDVDVEVEVSSGTYVRALARDVGEKLGVGGHLTALRRTRVGSFTLKEARTLEQLAAEVGSKATPTVIPMAQAAMGAFGAHHITAEEERALSYGQRIASDVGHRDTVAAITEEGRLAAILDESGPQAKSRVTFPA